MSTLTNYPQDNGKLYRNPRNGGIYLIDEGLRRWIPDPWTLELLFGSNPDITETHLIELVDAGPDITHGAVCALGPDSDTIYLIDNRVKRGIGNPETFDYYQFSKGTLVRLPSQIFLDFLPDGPVIVMPPSDVMARPSLLLAS